MSAMRGGAARPMRSGLRNILVMLGLSSALGLRDAQAAPLWQEGHPHHHRHGRGPAWWAMMGWGLGRHPSGGGSGAPGLIAARQAVGPPGSAWGTIGPLASYPAHAAWQPPAWPLHVAISIPPGFQAQTDHGLLPDIPFWSYLRWRRSLDPARFDHYHPRVGPMLAEDQWLRAQPAWTPTLQAQAVLPPVYPPLPHLPVPLHQPPPPPTPTPPPLQHGPSVPEPPTALMGLIMTVSALLARRYARRQA